MPRGGCYKPYGFVTRRQRERRLQVKERTSKESSGSGNANASLETVQPVCTNELFPEAADVVVHEGGYCFGEMHQGSGSSSDNVETSSAESWEDSSGSEDCSGSLDFDSFRLALAEWAAEGVTVRKINDLLHLLRQTSSMKALPADARTLLKTPRSTTVKQIGKGTYCHVGIRKTLANCINMFPDIGNSDVLNLQCNIDGLPLSKSSGSQVWPILMCLEDYEMISPFVVGIYHGYEKPQPCSEFLEDYVDEMTQLKNEGIEHNGKVLRVNVNSYVCDAPARAFVAQIKSHTGYSSCGKCYANGEYFKNKVVLNELTAPLRTDASFAQGDDEAHHVGVSPLLRIPGIKMVTQFPYEYMHLICLGVMRKMMVSWTNGALGVRLPSRSIALLNEKIIGIQNFVPCDFSRKPRPISDLLRWKATEFRMFILYTGPFLLKGILSPAVFQHFLSLHYAIRILASDAYIGNSGYAKTLLQYVVENYGQLYGFENLTYNVHGLIHLVDDCEVHGPLDKFSAFKFENQLQHIKKLVRKPNRVLPQIVRRLHEQSYFLTENQVRLTHEVNFSRRNNPSGDLPFGLQGPTYSFIEWKAVRISVSSPNNCVMLFDDTVAVVNLIAKKNGKVFFVCQIFGEINDAYKSPAPSGKIGIYIGSHLGGSRAIPLSDVRAKMMMLPCSTPPECEQYYLAKLL